MGVIIVQFSDASEKTISSVFGCPQDPDSYPFQGKVEADDERYATYLKSIPDVHKQALPSPRQRPAGKKSK